MDVGVEFTTMSKGYNMAGWRVGFLAGNAEMVNALGTIKAYYDYGMFQAIQIAAIMALRHTDAAVEAQAAIYQGRRDVLCRRTGADRLAHHSAPRPPCSCGPKFLKTGQRQMRSIDFAMKLLEEADVAVAPGAGFGPPAKAFCVWRGRERKPFSPGRAQIHGCLGVQMAALRV